MNAIVTGASKGIGKAIAQKLVQQGANIAICARQEKDIWATAKQLHDLGGVKIFHAVANLAQPEDCKRFATEAIEQLGTIDLLVNNAGTYIPGLIQTEPDGTLEQLMSNNVYSAYHLTRAVLPTMQKAMRGHIMNICSIAGLQPYANGGSYSISKYAMVGFSKNLREELKPHGIKVTTMSPGAVYTDSWAGSGVEPSRIMQASDVADLVWSMYNLAPQSVVEEIVLRPLLGDL